MSIFMILTLVFLAALVVMFIVLIILRFTRTHTTIVPEEPSLEELHQTGSAATNLVVSSGVKSFRVTSDTRVQPIEDALRWGLSQTPSETAVGSNQLAGFMFHTTTPTQVVALQFIPALFNHPGPVSASVAIYDMVARVEITSPLDRFIDLNNASVANGFLTHTLTTPITLTAYKQYACVTLLQPTDLYLGFADAASINTVVVEGSASTPGATTFGVPTTTGPTGDIKYYCSFQLTRVNEIGVNVFDVDLFTGGVARMPPGYMRGLNVSSQDGKTITVEQGVCLSAENAANIVLPVPISLLTQFGIGGVDEPLPLLTNYWYHVYVIGSSSLGLQPNGILSINPQSPNLKNALGYDIYRRLGCVRWRGSSWDIMQQNGDNVTRTTFYSSMKEETTMQGPQSYTPVTLTFVPPTAVSVDLGVACNMANSTNPLSTPIDVFVRFRQVSMVGEGPWTVSVQNAERFFEHIVVAPDATTLPLQIACRIFAGTFGTIPDDSLDPNVGILLTTISVMSYTENL